MEAATPGYAASKDAHLKRLRRIEGQVRGLARMVDEDAFVVFGVEYLMGQHHQCLVVDFGDIGVAGLGDPGGVEFTFLDLDSEVEPVLGGQGVAHPDVLAVFEGLVLVPGRGDAMETQLAKQRQEDLFDEVVLAAALWRTPSTRHPS